MIRVVITGLSRKGLFPYRVDGHHSQRGEPLEGRSEAPLLDACRRLERMGEAQDATIGLFSEGAADDQWRLRTTLRVGASLEIGRGGFKRRPISVR